MALTYSELHRMQQELIAAADADVRTDDELLKYATADARSMGDGVVDQLTARIGSRLHHHQGNELVRQLCRGVLSAMLQRREEARELLTFAAELVQRASHASPFPASLGLPEQTTAKAREQFESYIARPAQIDTLTAEARKFVVENESLAGGILFARFLADLEFLRKVVSDETNAEEARRAAAGALTYLVEARDAVVDTLGVVGILDDAYIAKFAAERIDPSRRAKAAFVDALLKQWSFLARLQLTFDPSDGASSPWSPSEFVLLNLAVGFGPEAATKNAIVLPSVSGLSVWLGVLAALGLLNDTAEEGAPPFRPRPGDFVAVAGHDDEPIEVLGYFQPPGGRHADAASPENARLVKLRYPPRSKKSGGAPVTEWCRVAFLDACVPTSPHGARRAALPRSAGDVDLGPLERVFGATRPLRFESTRRRIVVVSPLGVAREALEKTRLFGRPLIDLIPCGRVRPDEGYALEWWSTRRTDGLPVLTIVRDISEAAALVTRHGATPELSVVAPLDTQDWDAAALAQLGEARIVALVPQWQVDAQKSLSTNGYRFLDWTRELEGTVARRPQSSAPNELDEYERRVRRELVAEVNVHRVDLESVQCGMGCLKSLSQAVRSDYGDEAPGPLAKWTLGAQRLFFELNGTPIRLADDFEDRARRTFAELKHGFDVSSRSWTEQCATAAEAKLRALDGLLRDLSSSNPKEKVLADLLGRPGTRVRCENRHWNQLRARFPHAVPWLDDRISRHGPAVVFHWPGWKNVERIVLPPIGDPTHFVFYGWERDGLQRAHASRVARIAEHWERERRPQAWPVDLTPRSAVPASLGINANTSGEPALDVPSYVGGVEEWIVGLRRQSVASTVGSTGDDDPVVEAVPVYFTGGRYALYTRGFDVHVATNLNSLSYAGAERLEERPATSLRIGDVVVVRTGSETDAIRERADSRLPAGARDLARTWHGALLRMRDRLLSDRAVHRALVKVGCTKVEPTILGWLRSTDQIGPHDDADVDLIAKATSDPELLGKLDACKTAIHLVRGEHLRASHELFVRALEELRTRLRRGESLDEAIDLGDQIQLLIVEHADEAFISVASSATNVPRELS